MNDVAQPAQRSFSAACPETLSEPQRSAAAPQPNTAARLRNAMSVITANATEAASVVRTAAEDAGSDAIWGALRLIEWLRDRMAHRLATGVLGSVLDGPFPDASADIACVQAVLALVITAEDDELLEAAATILQVAQDVANAAIDLLQQQLEGGSDA